MTPSPIAAAIDTGDAVLHRPTGETWLVAYVNGDHLVCCGWPETSAKLTDCELVEKATRGFRISLLGQMAASSGRRGEYARERLARGETA